MWFKHIPLLLTVGSLTRGGNRQAFFESLHTLSSQVQFHRIQLARSPKTNQFTSFLRAPEKLVHRCAAPVHFLGSRMQKALAMTPEHNAHCLLEAELIKDHVSHLRLLENLSLITHFIQIKTFSTSCTQKCVLDTIYRKRAQVDNFPTFQCYHAAIFRHQQHTMWETITKSSVWFRSDLLA